MASAAPIKVLVTGASGFLGNAVVEALLLRNPPFEVTTLDRNPLKKGVADQVHRHIEADITVLENVRSAFEGYAPQLVVHTAGIVPARQARYSTSAQVWEQVLASNYTGTKYVLDAAMQSGCRCFVYTSSCTVLIDDVSKDFRNMNETIPIGNATLFYGKSKGLAEQYVLAPEHAEKDLKACALRPSTIIGPGDTQVISMLYDCIGNGSTSFVVGSGDNVYDWMFIDNAVLAHVLAVEDLLGPQHSAGHAFFISNQEPVYFWDFLLYVWAQFDHHPPFRMSVPPRIAWFAGWFAEVFAWLRGTSPTLSRGSAQDGIRTHYSNNDKAREILGYVPQVGMSEGVRRTCEAFKQHLRDQATSSEPKKTI